MKKVFKIFGIIVLALIGFAVLALMVIGSLAPETYVYEGKEVPKKYVKKVKEFGLVEEGETIEYLYSDAMFKLEEGVYVLTDRKLALHSTYWEFDRALVPYDSIAEILVEYDDSFLGDTMITLTAGDGVEYYFPMSSEKGRDHDVVATLERRSGVSVEVLSDE